jgi:hypothetical protein
MAGGRRRTEAERGNHHPQSPTSRLFIGPQITPLKMAGGRRRQKEGTIIRNLQPMFPQVPPPRFRGASVF